MDTLVHFLRLCRAQVNRGLDKRIAGAEADRVDDSSPAPPVRVMQEASKTSEAAGLASGGFFRFRNLRFIKLSLNARVVNHDFVAPQLAAINICTSLYFTAR